MAQEHDAAHRRMAGRSALLALALAFALLVVGVTAQPSAAADDVPAATRYAVNSPAMQIAQGIAQANWGTSACGGQVTVEWGADEPNINARSFWANPVSSYDNPDLNLQCRIVFNSSMAYTWPKFCTVLVHEYGHLTGHPHSADGPDVMSPIYRAPLPACVTADPSAPAAPAPAAPAPLTTTPAAASTSTSTPAPVVDGAVEPRTTRRARAARTRARGKATSKVRAHLAAAPLKQYGDADSEPLPWTPFLVVAD